MTPSSLSSLRSWRPRWFRTRAAARFFRNRAAVVGLMLVGILVVFAWLAPLLVSVSPNDSDFVHGFGPEGQPSGPSWYHWLGTDTLVRDELARLAYGARLSLVIALSATTISSALGAVVGIVSGYTAEGRYGWLDVALMRLVDVLLCFPYLLLVLAIGAALQQTTMTTVLTVLGLTSWLGTARLLRAKTLEVRNLGYVEAARALGQSTPVLLFRHVLPNVAGPLIVVSTASVASMILAESVLSYLQVGLPPPTPTWGRMLAEGQRSVTVMPRLVIAPGVAIVASMLGFNLVGEGLRDAFDTREIP